MNPRNSRATRRLLICRVAWRSLATRETMCLRVPVEALLLLGDDGTAARKIKGPVVSVTPGGGAGAAGLSCSQALGLALSESLTLSVRASCINNR